MSFRLKMLIQKNCVVFLFTLLFTLGFLLNEDENTSHIFLSKADYYLHKCYYSSNTNSLLDLVFSSWNLTLVFKIRKWNYSMWVLSNFLIIGSLLLISLYIQFGSHLKASRVIYLTYNLYNMHSENIDSSIKYR